MCLVSVNRGSAGSAAALAPILLSCQFLVGLHEGKFTDARTDGEDAIASCGSTPCPSGKACDESSGVCVPRACAGMVPVPAGQFLMGSNDMFAPMDVRPEHEVRLSAFRIDACEVTVGQFKTCVAADVCSRPSNNGSNTRLQYYDVNSYNDFPVIHVSWNDASQYCEWAGKRLPTEAQWEKAARGGCELGSDPAECDEGDRRTYPWGSGSPTCFLAHFAGCIPADTVENSEHPDGASPYGALDMAGNVMEWVGDWYDTRYYSQPGSWIDPTGPETGWMRSLRGGAYDSSATDLPVYFRDSRDPDDDDQNTGFRCAQ